MGECISIRLNIWASLLEGTVKRERVGEDGGPRVMIALVACSAGANIQFTLISIAPNFNNSLLKVVCTVR